MNLLISDFINPWQNLPAEDPLGLEAWSRSRGLEPHTGLAVVTCVLSGIAGPMRSFELPGPGSAGAGCNLIATEADGLVSMAASELIQPLFHVQEALVTNARNHTCKELDDAMYDPGLRIRNSELLAKLRKGDTESSDLSDQWAESKLARDITTAPRSILFEGQLRPNVILTGSCRGDLVETLQRCHSGMGFAAGSVESLPFQTGPRNRRINEIIAGFRGITTDRPSVGSRIAASVETVRLSGLLRFPEPDFSWIVGNRKDLLATAVPISSRRSGSTFDEDEVDEASASRFLSLFDKVARNTIACRHYHHWLNRKFSDQPAVHEFVRLQRTFTREVHESAGAVTVHGAAGLPSQMAWALLLLAGQNQLDDYIISTVFAAARRLHADTLVLFAQHDQAALAQRRLVVAHKMVARVTILGPCTRRTLVRGLDQQALHLHEPLIRALIDEGIFTEDGAGFLSLGRVPLKTLAATRLIDNPSAP